MPQYFPFEKYGIKKWRMSSALLRSAQGTQWPIYIKNSMPPPSGAEEDSEAVNLGKPFGYLVATDQEPRHMNMIILPYNFPELFNLLREINGTFVKLLFSGVRHAELAKCFWHILRSQVGYCVAWNEDLTIRIHLGWGSK